MGVVKKEGLRNTAIYYSGVVLGYFTTIILLPKILHEDQYGLVRILVPYSGMLAFFFLAGMPNVIIRFFPYLKNKRKGHNGILFFAFLVAGTATVITTVVFFIFKPGIIHFYADKAALLVHYYYLLFPLAISSTIFEVFNAYCRAQFKTYFANFLNEVFVRLLVMAVATLYFFHYFDFNTFIWLYVGCYLTNPLMMVFYILWNKMLYLKPSRQIFKSEQRNKMLSYGFFNFFGGATGMLLDKLDLLFIPGLLSLANAGIYGVAVLLAQAVNLPAKALLTILFPLTADAFKSEDKEKLGYLYKTSCSVQLFAGSFVFLMIWTNFDSFFQLVHHQFLLGKYAFLILSIGRLVDMATGINGLLVMNSKYYRTDLIFTIILFIVTFIGNRLLIPIFGLEGAATATASGIILYNVFKYIFVWKMLKLQPFGFNTLKTVLTIVAIFMVTLILPASGNAFFDMMYKSTIVLSLFLFSLFYLKITPEITDLVVSVYNRGWQAASKPFRKK